MKILLYLIHIALVLSFSPIINFYFEIENARPNHCGVPAKYKGNHVSLAANTLFYQCPECKEQFVVPNPHNGIPLRYLWQIITSSNPSVEEKKT